MKTDARSLGNVSIFGAVLEVLFGISISFVGLALFFITVASAVGGLVKNVEQDRSVKIKCSVGLGVSAVLIVLWLLGVSTGVIMPFMQSVLK